MDQLEKSDNSPLELSVQTLIKGVLALEQGQAKKTLAAIQKGLERLVTHSEISSHVAREFRKTKTEVLEKEKERKMKKCPFLGRDCDLPEYVAPAEYCPRNCKLLIDSKIKSLEEKTGLILNFAVCEEEYKEQNKAWFSRLLDETKICYLQSGGLGDNEVYYDLIKIKKGEVSDDGEKIYFWETGNVIPVPVFSEIVGKNFQDEKTVVSFLEDLSFFIEKEERKEVRFGRDNCHSSCYRCEFYSEYREKWEEEDHIHEYVNSYCSNEQWKNDPSTGKSWCVPHKVIMPTPRHRGVAPTV